MKRHTIERLLLIAILLALAFVSFQRFFEVTAEHLTTPYDLKIESHNLATIKALKGGQPIYDRNFFEDIPFIITIYNPVYFLLVATLPQHVSNPFFTGRLVSLISTVLVLLLLFLPGHQNNCRHMWFLPLFAVVWLLSLPIFVESAAYLHPDILALFLAGAAIVIIQESPRFLTVITSSFLASLAFATKQNFVCASLASFTFLLFLDRRKATVYAGASAVFLGSFFLIVPEILGKGYWFSTFFSVLRHPAFLTLTIQRLFELFMQPMFGLLAASIGLTLIYVALKHRQVFTDNPYLLYLEIAGFVPLVGLGKIGSEVSYYLEFMLASLLWLVFFTRRFLPELSQRHWITFLVCFVISFFLDLNLTDRSGYVLTEHPNNRYFQSNVAEQIKAEIKALDPPNENFLVINTHALCPLFQKAHFNDPYNYWLMWNYHIIKPDSMIKAIESKYFSVIMYAPENNPHHIPAMNPIPTTSATANVLQAIKDNYQLSKIGAVSYFLPLR
jgi:hypothetical protein